MTPRDITLMANSYSYLALQLAGDDRRVRAMQRERNREAREGQYDGKRVGLER